MLKKLSSYILPTSLTWLASAASIAMGCTLYVWKDPVATDAGRIVAWLVGTNDPSPFGLITFGLAGIGVRAAIHRAIASEAQAKRLGKTIIAEIRAGAEEAGVKRKR